MHERLHAHALHQSPFPFANKCAIALHEKGVRAELRTPLTFGAQGDDPAFLSVNPFAEVPAFVDGDVRLFESDVIFDYIDRRWPEPQLLPVSVADRAQHLLIERVLDKRFEPINWALTELLHLGRIQGDAEDRVRATAEREAAALNAWLARRLDDKNWLSGDGFGAADIFAGVHLLGAEGHGLAPREGRLAAWLNRVRARDSFAAAQARAAEFLSSLTPESVAQWVSAPRQYRDNRLEWVVKHAGVDVIAEGLASNRIWFSTGPERLA